MLSKLKHRADVNAMSRTLKKKILEEVKNFVWTGKEKRARVRWEEVVQKAEEGGIGIMDPTAALDASKIRMLTRLITSDRQPWMKWIERKLVRVAEKWGVKEAMAAKTTKKQRDGLREDCLVEATLKIWLEIGGTMREGEKGVKDKEREQEEKTGRKARDRTGFGVEIGKEWVPIEKLKSKQVYEKLIKQE